MSCIWASDLHLDESPRNAYRWEILPWLESEGRRRRVDFIGINGDFTEAKDRHSSRLVNRIADFVWESRHQWVFNTGNHDYYDPGEPFFRFLSNAEHIRWVTEATVLELPIIRKFVPTLILPAAKDWKKEWGLYHTFRNRFPYIFVHATFEGTPSESGFKLEGVPTSFFTDRKGGFGRLYAGDIHMPGEIAPYMEYIGCPYRVNFGDTFTPRVLHFTDGSIGDICPPMRSRHTLTVRTLADLDKFEEVRPEDQVKLRVRLNRNQLPEWRSLRREFEDAAQDRGWEVCGIKPYNVAPVRRDFKTGKDKDQDLKTPEDHVREFAKAQRYGADMVDAGLSFLPRRQ